MDEQESVSIPDVSPADAPEGIDRRTFLMRHAMIGAALLITGCEKPAKEREEAAAAGAKQKKPSAVSKDLNVSNAAKGTGHDGARGVLQDRARPVELAHDRPDEDHVRLLSALHETPRGSAGESHRAEGPPLWQPQRHRQGTRHRACGPRWAARQRAGHDQSPVPRRTRGESHAAPSPEAWRQDVPAVPGRHHL